MSQAQCAEKNPALQPGKTIADLLLDYLRQLSVDFVFGVPGGAIEGLYNALARSERQGGPRAIVARHETGAAFMADGYYRETGRLGVCCSTTGPGATNLLTGVASAYANQIPMLVITAQTALSHFGRNALQESSCTGINTVGMFQHCTRYNTLVSHADQFEHKLFNAILTALRLPAGPVHLSIPKDILESRIAQTGPSFDLNNLLTRSALVDSGEIDALFEHVSQAKKVVMMIGAGCNEAIGDILGLAATINALVVAAPHGKGLIDAYHPLFRGIIGFGGHSSARDALIDPQVDAILAIGTNLGEWASNGWDYDAVLNSRLIHIDVNEEHLTHSPMAKLHVRGHVATVIQLLLERVQHSLALDQTRSGSFADAPPFTSPRPHQSPTGLPFKLDDQESYDSDATPISPQHLMRLLARLFPIHTRFAVDAGSGQAWAIHYLHSCSQGLTGQQHLNSGVFRTCLEFNSMGWAIGAAIGTALGNLSFPVVCITGDGSLLMSGQELTVAIQEKLPVIFVVLNDAALGMVKHGQRLGGAEPIAFALPEIDYCAYAKTMGAEGHIIRSPQDLNNLDINGICQRAGPTLLDVRIDPEKVPPISTRIKVLGGDS
ncbi:MAG: thiamine pyrophosphate-binding protein [Methylococcaceae bacterium]|nr:MAG: thiamine pyrophosphate-binding protein [Methylococcaceae bacterium]